MGIALGKHITCCKGQGDLCLSISYRVRDSPTSVHEKSIFWVSSQSPSRPAMIQFLFQTRVPFPRFMAKKMKTNEKAIFPSIWLSPIPSRLMPTVKTSHAIFTSLLPQSPPSRLPSHHPALPYRAHGAIAAPQQFLQGSLCSIFLGSVHVLPVVPVASRDRNSGDGDVAGPGGALAPTVREDFVFWG